MVERQECSQVPKEQEREVVETKCTVVQREQCFPYPDWQCEEVQQPAEQCRQLPEEVCRDTVRTVTKYVVFALVSFIGRY